MKALGLIQTDGLVCALEAADAASKAANVQVIGWEIVRSGPQIILKLQGDVSSVTAAMEAAQVAAARVNKVLGVTVIARPDPGIEKMVWSKETVGPKPATLPAAAVGAEGSAGPETPEGPSQGARRPRSKSGA